MKTRLLLVPLALASTLVLSCGAGIPAPAAPSWAHALPADLALDGTLQIRPESTEAPALDLRLPWRNGGAMLGWGAAHFWARPGRDHVSVTAIFDAPSRTPRWGGCDEVALVVDGDAEPVPTRYIGHPVEGADMVYEAVQLELNVQHLRSLALGRTAEAEVCGDRLVLTGAQQATVRRFVEWFDHLSARRWHGHRAYYRDVSARPDLPLEEPYEGESGEG
ncbi:MAG: hypothetical protein AB8I08_12725 [Sandaracinaceae bacterium]